MRDFSLWARSLTAFAEWLEQQSMVTGRAWSKRLNSTEAGQVEGAIAEAVVWDFLGCRCDSTRLPELPGIGGVDFEFSVGAKTFRVEVANISDVAAANKSGMSDAPLFAGNYSLLTRKIRGKIRDKQTQAQQSKDHPLLVFVTTLHCNASRACFGRTAVEFAMSSPPTITTNFNPRTGQIEGESFQSTDLECSVFLSAPEICGESAGIGGFRSISGFLLGGFGLPARGVSVHGALNPEAARSFAPSLLPDIPFCSFREWPLKDRLVFDWTISREDEDEQRAFYAKRRLRAAKFGDFVDGIEHEGKSHGTRELIDD